MIEYLLDVQEGPANAMPCCVTYSIERERGGWVMGKLDLAVRKAFSGTPRGLILTAIIVDPSASVEMWDEPTTGA